MKSLIILLVSFLFLISCNNSYEQKIVYSFNHEPFRHHKKVKAKSAIIYDTIFQSEVIHNFEVFQKNIDSLDKEMKKMDSYRDSILRLHYSKPLQDSLMKIGFSRIMLLDQEMNHLIRRNSYNYKISSQIDDTINGYYAYVVTNKDTFDVIVTPLTFTIVGPSFMFKK